MAEPGYGTDIFCYDRLITGRLVSGVEVVAQALFRRLTTPRGTLRGGEDESIYGLDLLDFIGRVSEEQALDTLPSLIEAECLKDDRLAECTVTLTRTTATDGTVALVISINAVTAPQGDSFDLTLAVANATVSVIGFAEAA